MESGWVDMDVWVDMDREEGWDRNEVIVGIKRVKERESEMKRQTNGETEEGQSDSRYIILASMPQILSMVFVLRLE